MYGIGRGEKEGAVAIHEGAVLLQLHIANQLLHILSIHFCEHPLVGMQYFNLRALAKRELETEQSEYGKDCFQGRKSNALNG